MPGREIMAKNNTASRREEPFGWTSLQHSRFLFSFWFSFSPFLFLFFFSARIFCSFFFPRDGETRETREGGKRTTFAQFANRPSALFFRIFSLPPPFLKPRRKITGLCGKAALLLSRRRFLSRWALDVCNYSPLGGGGRRGG